MKTNSVKKLKLGLVSDGKRLFIDNMRDEYSSRLNNYRSLLDKVS